jgi:hypothetical protein
MTAMTLYSVENTSIENIFCADGAFNDRGDSLIYVTPIL